MTSTELTTKLQALATKSHVKDFTLLAGRLLLSVLFLHEGVTLTTHFDAAAKAMAAQGVSLPLFIATVALQLGAGLSIGLGLLTRLGAIGLGLFCLATATLFHTNFASQNELLHFEKDLAIAGGMFVLAAAGAGKMSLDGVVAGYVRQQRHGKEMVGALMAADRHQGETSLPI